MIQTKIFSVPETANHWLAGKRDKDIIKIEWQPVADGPMSAITLMTCVMYYTDSPEVEDRDESLPFDPCMHALDDPRG